MGMPLIFMIFSAFTVCASSGFRIPSISAVSTLLKANLGPPSLSFRENYRSNYISPTMSTSPNFERKSYGTLAPSPKYSFDNLAPKYSSPTKAPARRHAKFHRHHHDPSYIPQTHTDQGDILGPSIAPSRSNYPFAASSSSPAPAPSKDSNQFITAPTSSFVKNRATPPPSSFLTLPPPPPNKG